MAQYVIIPDSSSDFTEALRKRFDVPEYLHGVLYRPDGTQEPLTLDWETFTPEEYYTSMGGRQALYKTAAPPMGEIRQVFEKYLQQGKDILSISISSGLSSTYQDTRSVAEELLKQYPERKIECVDSLRYSTALAMLIVTACENRDAGMSLEENAAMLREERGRIHQMGCMDDMFFLVKTGRISNFKAFFANLVGVNLLADFNNKTGMCEVLGRFKGKRDALRGILEYVERTVQEPEKQIMFVAHSNNPSFAKLLYKEVQERFSPKELIMTDVGPGCGATIGPGMCAVFFRGDPASEDMSQEKAKMDAIAEEIKRAK